MDQKESNYATYIERVRDNFHIFLCMSPVGDTLRIRCRMFPSLVNCCTLDWYDSWNEEALLSVSNTFISEFKDEIGDLSEELQEKLAIMCMYTHKSVEEMAKRFYEELRRKVYITPKSYLDGIQLYKILLILKRKDYKESIERLSNGLKTLDSTNKMIQDLQIKLTEMEP